MAFLHKDESQGVFGAVVNNIWSFGGPPHSSDRTNQLFFNPIVDYHFGDAANFVLDAGIAEIFESVRF